MLNAREERIYTAEKFASTSRKLLKPKCIDADVRQKFSHFLVIDLEATCDHKSNPPLSIAEIIEFPVFKVNSSNYEIESVFHTFVRPTVNPLLKPFCTQLTGIVQDDLIDAPTFPEALRLFELWMRNENLPLSSRPGPLLFKGSRVKTSGDDRDDRRLNDAQGDFAFVCYGDSDLGKMLPDQCAHLGIPTPNYFHSWINVKISFSESHGKWARSLKFVLDELNLPMQGRAHSGIDDCANLVNVLKAIAERKQFVYSITSTYKEDSSESKSVSDNWKKSFHL